MNGANRLWIALIAALVMIPAVAIMPVAAPGPSGPASIETAKAERALIVISRGSSLVLTSKTQRYDFSGSARMICQSIIDVGIASLGYDCKRT